jgi:hypothetical protein
VRSVRRGLRRRVGDAQPQKIALVDDALRQLIGAIDTETFAEARDRALLLVGFVAPSGAPEFAALDVEDPRFEPEGLVVRRSHPDARPARMWYA